MGDGDREEYKENQGDYGGPGGLESGKEKTETEREQLRQRAWGISGTPE